MADEVRWWQGLHDLADELEAIAEMAPLAAAAALGKLADRQSPASAEAQLRSIRSAAMLAVVNEFGGSKVRGSHARAAEALGVHKQTLSRLLHGNPSR